MSLLHMKYLLVGGGVASSQAAEEIRQSDPRGDMMLVGQEINRPYHRPRLSKQFLTGSRQENLFTLPSEWFVNHGVQLRTGTRVSHLDVNRHTATLDRGEEISFDKLLIATGGSAKHLELPGARLPNLFYLRTVEDANRLVHAIDKAKHEGRLQTDGKNRGRVTIIGAGVLGVELAGSLAQAGLQVDLSVGREFPWDKYVGEATGRYLAAFLQEKGIHVHANGRTIRVEGDGRVQRVLLNSGESVDCDFAVAAVGLEVHKEILRGTPIIAEKAILVNEACQTNIPDIYAAGDCAAVFDPIFGKHRLLNHWESAAETGRIAGINMAGGKASYDAVSHFQSSVFGLNMDVWGEPKLVERRIIRGKVTAESPRFIEIGVAADGRIAQVISVGDADKKDQLAELVRRRAAVRDNEEQLKDPAVPLSHLLGN
jgi:3-phenylpropionate/trans-cinnamate dioxygenase ferredoxin reductase component